MSLKVKILLGLGILVVLIAVLVVGGKKATRSFFYPELPSLPPVVAQSTEELLARLQPVLEQKAPEVARVLQPGISDEQIQALESKGKFHLSGELKALYRWHDGMSTNGWLNFIPGHFFYPLEEVVAGRLALEAQVKANTRAQRAAFEIFAGHTKSWVMILDDGAGDGYFYDPERNSFFYHFAETANYQWYPSLRNFLAGVIECYETGAFYSTNIVNSVRLEEDYERSAKIWKRLTANNYLDEVTARTFVDDFCATFLAVRSKP
jgi:cell wall assembly regulator SMI1